MIRKIAMLLMVLMPAGISTIAQETTVTVVQGDIYDSSWPSPYFGTFSADGKTFTTNAGSGVAGLKVTTLGKLDQVEAFGTVGDKGIKNMSVVAGSNNTDEPVTITAPDGYIIKDYRVTFNAFASGTRGKYKVTVAGVTQEMAYSTNKTFTATDVNAASTSFTIRRTTTLSVKAHELLITGWKLTLVKAQKTVDVTFVVTDLEGREMDRQVAAVPDGDVVSELPKSLRAPYTAYTYGEPLAVADGKENVFHAVVTYVMPFEPFTNYDDAIWYKMNITSGSTGNHPVVAAQATPWPTTGASQTGDNALWAFKGNPYDGIEVYNKAAGPGQTLKPNGTATGSAVAMQGGEPYKWTLKLGNMGFTLSDGTSAYINDQNGTHLAMLNDLSAASQASTALMLTAAATNFADRVASEITPWMESIGTGCFTPDTLHEAVEQLYNMYRNHDGAWAHYKYRQAMNLLEMMKAANAYVMPETGRFYRVKGNGGQYLQSSAASGNRLGATTAADASTIFYLDEGNTLLGYANGLYARNTCEQGAVDGNAAQAQKYSFKVCAPGEALVKGTGYLCAGTTTFSSSADNAAPGCRLALEEVAELPITLRKSGGKYYATFYSPVSIENFNIGANFVVNAYKVVSLNNDNVKLDLLDSAGAPANSGVLLVSDGDGSSTMTVTASIGEYCGPEKTTGLGGVTASEPASAHSSNYFFGQSKGVLGFWKMKANGATGGFKAYIGGTVSGGAKEGFGLLADDVTGIEAIGNEQPTVDSQAMYNLQGQKVTKARKGVYIVNNKKVVVR